MRIALAAVVLAVFAHTRADPDLWGNVRFGHDIVSARSVHLTDSYSFDSDRPWTNHEWLSEVFIYEAYAAAGGFGLVALKLVLLLAVAAAAIATMAAARVEPPALDLLMALLLLGSVPQGIHVRPQLFSMALFAWLLASLVRAARGHERWLWAAPPLMIAWANLHGGWLVGAGTLAVWASAGLIAPVARRERVLIIGVAAAAIVATVLNPYGWTLWTFLRDTVGFGRFEISDWQPVYRLGTVYLLLWLLVASAAGAGLWTAARSRSLDPRNLAIVAMFAVASFRVNRLLAFFAIAVVLLLNQPIASMWRGRNREMAAAGPISAGRLAIAICIALVVLVGSVSAAVRSAGCVAIEREGNPDPDVARFVSTHHLHGRMLTWFGWGHYAIWYFTPEISISMDGRRETLYSDAEIQRHLHFYFVPDARRSAIDALKPDYIWLPAGLPVVQPLRSDGWKPVFEGTESVLLARDARLGPAEQAPYQGPRCFPGP